MDIELLPGWLSVQRPGGVPEEVVAHSRYREPIARQAGRISGRSRRWGDISLNGQRQVVAEILQQAKNAGVSCSDAAMTMALVRLESGFNPDAAAAKSSASGLGQFIDSTGRSYGLTAENRFAARNNIRAVLLHLQDLRVLLGMSRFELSNPDVIRLYAGYHDGPSGGGRGREIAEKQLLPWFKKITDWLCRS